MNTISFQAFTDAGCMVIFDPTSGLQPTDEWLHCLNHVTDPEGKTNLTCDYPTWDWSKIWQSQVARMRELSSNGEFTLVLCDEVEHACRVSEEILETEAPRVQTRFEEWVYAPSGRLVIVDAMTAFSGEPMDEGPFAEMPVTPGWNKVTILGLAEPTNFDHIEGFEGSEEYPAIVFSVQSDSGVNRSAPLFFPRTKTNYVRVADGLCKATVMNIEGNRAKLRLHASRSTDSGFGRLIITDSKKIETGECLLVRLREDKKSFWLVELA